MYEKQAHGEWLSLLEISGPFLAETVLESHFPQGLDELDPAKRKLLRQAYEEWREAEDEADPSFEELHAAWIDLVLKQGLELDEDDDEDVLKPGNKIDGLAFAAPEHGVVVTPDYAVVTGDGYPPSMLIKTLPSGTDLEAVSRSDGWAASAVERMLQLCRATKVRLGLLTNGERWMLIDAPEGGVTTYCSWYARLWGQEPITLQAFVNLLGIRRFFLDVSQQLPALLDESLKHQDEVTDALGDQVKRAVEVLVQALDKADQDRERELLKDVEPAELYEAGLTVMMRLVFLLSAEERGLLLLGDERYEAYYAVSSLRMQLRDQAGAHSEEILSHRRDAWSRLLAIFRAVYGGVDHETLRMPALGGSLFDPDRFPFLEGRAKGSNWRHDPAKPLPIDNRTVLLLLDSIQLFQGRTLSYRALDVEQMGYVYEGLLERTVVRANDVTLELEATKKSKKPWVTWGELEDARLSGEKAVKALMAERTGSQPSRIENDLNKPISDAQKGKLLVVCLGDQALRDRLAPYYHFLRIDPWGYPLVYPKGAFMVATGSDRRETGTHYTPKSLTESIVKETLEPIAYIGPAEGIDRKDWKLKTPQELLDLKICDLAMGSGAFLVQVCRWLSERLLEAWAQSESYGKYITSNGIVVDSISNQEPMTTDAEERLVTARRLVSERCLYGVDINPLAVELAKLSVWLITLAKGRPFGFLDHNLRHGDSLLGITSLEQLYFLDMKVGKGSERKLFAQKIEKVVQEVVDLRLELRQRPILDIHDVNVMTHLDNQAREKLELPALIADALVGETFKAAGEKAEITALSIESGQAFDDPTAAFDLLKMRIKTNLNIDLQNKTACRRAFHWCLEFPEVFIGGNKGFDAIVGNPPYVGGQKISGSFGSGYGEYLKNIKTLNKKAVVDLVVYFTIHAVAILKNSGCMGLVVRRSISEGKNRETGLDQIIKENICVYHAKTDVSWPGQASVVIHHLHCFKGCWKGASTLNGRQVSIISSYLSEFDSGSPEKLRENGSRAYQGNILLGEGFKLPESEAKELIAKDVSYAQVLCPFIGGNELNNNFDYSPQCWVINFRDWGIEESKKYPIAFEKVQRSVFPIRAKNSRKERKEKWWMHAERASALYHSIGRENEFNSHPKKYLKLNCKLQQVLAISTGVTKYPAFTFLQPDMVYSNKLCVIADERYEMFAILSSDIHSVWAWKNKTSMGGDLSSMVYAHGNIFETFPFPKGFFTGYENLNLADLGRRFHRAREAIMRDRKIGLTKFYNEFHRNDNSSVSFRECRVIQKELNNAVASAYGVSQLNLGIDFHRVSYLPAESNLRYTVSEGARNELLGFLSRLNNEVHEAETSNKSRKTNVTPIIKSGKRPPKDWALDKVAEPPPQLDIFGQEDE